MHTPRILLVVTSAARMGDSPKPTGSWIEEVAAPYYTFLDAKCDVTIASPLGGAAPIDPESCEEVNQTASTRRYDADQTAQAAMANSQPLSSIAMSDYDALFFAGGHGTMVDFPTDPQVKRLVEQFYEAGKPVSAVCHGPACFVAALSPRGEPLISGHRFTCFTDAEETSVGLAGLVPFMLETTLREQGGIARTAPSFSANVVVDRQLITGQNPASAIPTAEAVIHFLRSMQRRDAA